MTPSNHETPLVEARDISVRFPVGRAGLLGQRKVFVHAVSRVSLTIRRGETLGLVGESGSGKTTTGRALLRRVDVTSGSICFQGNDITHIRGQKLRHLRRDMQMIFQDPFGSLNPRMTVSELVSEPLIVHGIVRSRPDIHERVSELLNLVRMPADAAERYPHAFSGGQRQRIGIARALALRPAFVVADEPVSALDVSVRSQIVNLMHDLQDQLGLTYLFIAHDLAIVRQISDRIAIMYAGKVVEIADRDSIYLRPRHPYTQALLSAVPVPDPRLQRHRSRVVLSGEIPSSTAPPAGCRFYSRCPIAVDKCKTIEPPLEEKASGQWAACWVR